MCLQPWLEWRRSKLHWYVKLKNSVLHNYILQFIDGKILLLEIKLGIFNYLSISMILIHKTCSSRNLILILRVLIAVKFLDGLAFVSLEIILQNLISVHFLQKYQLTIVYAVPL